MNLAQQMRCPQYFGLDPLLGIVSRWGDAPLRTVQMALFLNISAEVEEMRWFSYMHDKVTANASGAQSRQCCLLRIA
jgi:hypothetical protein